MPTLKKITVYRHNLLGSDDQDQTGLLVNEVHYDEQGNEIARFTYNSEGELEEHIKMKLENGLPVEERLELNGEPAEYVSRTFDEKGRLITLTKHYLEGGNDTTTYTYEGDHLVLKQVVDSDGEEGEKSQWKYSDNKLQHEVNYDNDGDLENEKIYTYDDDGLLSEITEIAYNDGVAEKTVSVMDEQERLIAEKKYDAKGRLVARNIITYNEDGKAIQIEEENTRGKKIVTMEYDEAGNNTFQQETDFDGSPSGHIERTFDKDGHVLEMVVVSEPSVYQPGQNYRLEYIYEFH